MTVRERYMTGAPVADNFLRQLQGKFIQQPHGLIALPAPGRRLPRQPPAQREADSIAGVNAAAFSSLRLCEAPHCAHLPRYHKGIRGPHNNPGRSPSNVSDPNNIVHLRNSLPRVKKPATAKQCKYFIRRKLFTVPKSAWDRRREN